MSLYEREGQDFSRRLLLLGGLQGGLFAVLAGRLQFLQIARSDVYATLAEANRVNITQISAMRGRITDRNGKLLADNDRNFQIRMVPERVANMEATLRDLAQILNLSQTDVFAIRRRIARGPSFKPVVILENLSWDDFSHFNLDLPYLSGVEPLVGQKRVYPHAHSVAHLVGFVGVKTRADLQRVGDIVGDNVGRSGVERDFERDLRGTPGVRHVEVNALGRTVRELQSEPGEQGRDLSLSIDLDVQEFSTRRMQGHSGSVVVMDIFSGEVVTMVSAPSFDLNMLSRGIDVSEWEKLVDHERKPLVNKTMRGLYAPGSTFKMLVALAALEEKLIDPEEKIECSGVFDFANEQFHCWRSEGHGPVNMIDALERSCDTYFYDLALRVGIDRIEAISKRFGFGALNNIDLEGEKGGTVPGRDWKRANFDTSWRGGETIITAIGQGYLLTTPLQLAVMTAALANGGKLITPRITRLEETPPPHTELALKPENLAVVQRGMYRAVNRPDGTAYASSLLIDGARMSGKTGTVQVRRISKDERLKGVTPNHKLDWHLRDHSLFVGYVPHDKPRYAISVVIEHGGGGALVAAPIARDIMVQLLRKAKAEPVQELADDKGDKNGGARL
jgi:penicillin-binding protein 2